MITLPGGVAPSAEFVIDTLKHQNVDAIVLVASLFEQITKVPNTLDFITSRIGTITYAGDDVSQSADDVAASKSKLFNFNGSTEIETYPLLRPRDRYPFED